MKRARSHDGIRFGQSPFNLQFQGLPIATLDPTSRITIDFTRHKQRKSWRNVPCSVFAQSHVQVGSWFRQFTTHSIRLIDLPHALGLGGTADQDGSLANFSVDMGKRRLNVYRTTVSGIDCSDGVHLCRPDVFLGHELFCCRECDSKATLFTFPFCREVPPRSRCVNCMVAAETIINRVFECLLPRGTLKVEATKNGGRPP
jgi:hypothetical protein